MGKVIRREVKPSVTKLSGLKAVALVLGFVKKY